ncbi:MAG: HAMP domain-containing protein [Gammaproteobacteria bacterium]|nr:HAMP domain-containing protein [Gammaproteobacteria bacterium]
MSSDMNRAQSIEPAAHAPTVQSARSNILGGVARLLAGRRFPAATVAVLGLGLLVAISVGVVLSIGVGSATANTRALLQAQGEALIDFIELRVDARLTPVMSQARWVAQAIERGEVDLDAAQTLDAFMFGALAGTPQVAGIAIVETSGRSRRWSRAPRQMIDENWSDRPDVVQWLEVGRTQQEPAWRSPFWTQTLNTTVVLYDTPLRIAGRYIGMLGQVVPISELSGPLELIKQRTGMVPFILYDKKIVLAHASFSSWRPERTAHEVPLPTLQDFGDRVLARIWNPDQADLFMLRESERIDTGGAEIDDAYHVYLYRDIARYGAVPWTVGAYLNTQVQGSSELKRLNKALAAGGIVLVLSVICAAYAGKRFSAPIERLSAAARAVLASGLEAAPAVARSRIRELDDAAKSFNAMVAGLRDRALIRETLGRFVPEKVAQALLADGGTLNVQHTQATVLFCDLEGFTALTEAVGPTAIVALLNEYFEDMVSILEAHNGVVTQFQGDAILATFNVPLADECHAVNAARAAVQMQQAVRCNLYGGQRIASRIGLDTGPLVAGAVGARGRLSYTVHGDAVNLAARLEALNKELGTRILVSQNTALLLADAELRSVGRINVRGRQQAVEVFELAVGR